MFVFYSAGYFTSRRFARLEGRRWVDHHHITTYNNCFSGHVKLLIQWWSRSTTRNASLQPWRITTCDIWWSNASRRATRDATAQPPITATTEVAIRALKSVATWWRLPRLASHETKQSKRILAVRPDTLWHWRHCLCLPRKLALGLREELVVVESEEELHEEGTRLLVAHATENREQQVRLPLKVLQPRHCKLSVMYV